MDIPACVAALDFIFRNSSLKPKCFRHLLSPYPFHGIAQVDNYAAIGMPGKGFTRPVTGLGIGVLLAGFAMLTRM